MKKAKIDMHIHSCLSPCADDAMVPSAIVSKALFKGLDAIGISDHNSAENVEAVQKAGYRVDLAVIGGIEITTKEEIHILGFFDCLENLMAIQETVYSHLDGENREDYFGKQLVVDSYDGIAGKNYRLLIGATNISIDTLVNQIHEKHGIVVASHIDRPVFSIVSQLGFIPEGMEIDAIELSPNYRRNTGSWKIPSLPRVTFSDAHTLEDIGKAFTQLAVGSLTVKAIRESLNKKCSREVG